MKSLSPQTVGALSGATRSRAARVPHQVWALAVCAVFVAVGVAVLDDYGVSWDEFYQRGIALETISYVLGEDDELLRNHDKFYGTAFEMPLLIAERVLGLQDDTRAILLSRHFLTHLFFIAGGFCCYLLARRLFGSTIIALIAMLLFLLHPRMYAESFVNTKDLPLLSMFMIALFLAHRAFRKDTVGAFLLCGVAVGILVNIRILGVFLFAAVLAISALDLLRDSVGRHARLLTGGVFALATTLTLYATLPYLWADPVGRVIEMFATLSHHPSVFPQLFRGELINGNDLPPHYIPTWVAITTPPVALLLGIVGMAAVIRRGLINPLAALRNVDLKFGFLLIGCLILPIAAAVAVTPTMYNGWRQMYFLYAPFCLLAAFGLHWLASAWGRPDARAAVYALAAAGLGVVVIQMVQIHPYQQTYFNFLVDRETPGRLTGQYPMEYWGTSYIDGLRWLLETYPDASIHVRATNGHDSRNYRLLPKSDRQRINLNRKGEAITDFYITNHFKDYRDGRKVDVFAPVIHTREVYNNTVLSVAALDLSLVDDAIADAYRQAYRTAAAGDPIASGRGFDVYRDQHENTLTYVNESCEPGDISDLFVLSITPIDANDLPVYVKQRGAYRRNLYFDFGEKGVTFDGKCLMVFRLPEYPIIWIRVGHRAGKEYTFWKNDIGLDGLGTIIIQKAGDPVVRSQFDVYRHEKILVYLKEPCAPADTDAYFFLHLIPADERDLPDRRKQYGFDNLDFAFDRRGAMFEGKCMAIVALPGYDIASIRTGQFVPGEGRVWEGSFDLDGRR